jgi:hypothetical protein
VELASLPGDRQIPAGRPVLVDGQLRFMALTSPMVWPQGLLVEQNPVALLLGTGRGAMNDQGDMLLRARVLACIQLASDGHAPTLEWILERTGHPRAAQLVHEQDCEDWLMAPLGFPTAHQLLAHAFAGSSHRWERDVLAQACIDCFPRPSLPADVVPVPIPD